VTYTPTDCWWQTSRRSSSTSTRGPPSSSEPPASELLGQDIRKAIPLQENDGRSWWDSTDPWNGLAIRSGHREKLLIIPGLDEVLVTARYVRPGRSMPVSQVVVSIRDAEARRRAEANNSALISTVAHELRSPLTSVKGFSSTLLRRWDRFTDEQKRLMLQTIEADADRVTRLITELLDISRIDSGRMQVRKQPVDVREAINRHIERFVASGSDRERFCLEEDDRPLPEVWADPDRVDQILANLMENAVRHGAGRVTMSVVPTGSAGEEAIAITVGDEGDGIAPEHYPMVFTRFWHGSAAVAPAWVCTSCEDWWRPTAGRSVSAGQREAGPSSDSGCPQASRSTSADHGDTCGHPDGHLDSPVLPNNHHLIRSESDVWTQQELRPCRSQRPSPGRPRGSRHGGAERICRR